MEDIFVILRFFSLTKIMELNWLVFEKVEMSIRIISIWANRIKGNHN